MVVSWATLTLVINFYITCYLWALIPLEDEMPINLYKLFKYEISTVEKIWYLYKFMLIRMFQC